jgi:hypothetical protein
VTAEIAILNRTAVALAADSVVTLSSLRGRKTYDSAEKIFELSRSQPIGLMIYNNAQHLNAPLEVVVRNFRSSLSTTTQFDRLEAVWPAFSEYLLAFPHSGGDELEHLRRMVAVELDKLQMIHTAFMIESVFQGRRPRGERSEDRVRQAIADRRAEADAAPIEGYLEDKTEIDFIDLYGPTIDAIANVVLKAMDLNAALRQEIYGLFFALVRSRLPTDAFTGFVFAGFGKSDLFPTLHSIEVDGIYFGGFRVIRNEVTDIDRQGDTAAVVPFAQIDMAERFIFGIDSSAVNGLEKIMMSMVGNVLTAKPRAFPAAVREQLLDAARAQFRDGVEKLKTQSEQNLKGVVDHLSKKELADVAYSLVELTSRKRRYSSELETVGGPIDVAILTQNEGFIWVRRKHYFDAELNPAFFKRVK